MKRETECNAQLKYLESIRSGCEVPELLLHFRWDSEAFDCVLDGLIVGPDIQAALW